MPKKSTLQSVRFSRKQWSLGEARRWLEKHGYNGGKVDTTENQYRFRQREPPSGDKHFVTKKLTNGVELVLFL